MTRITEQVTTAEQLAALPDDGKRYELVDGALSMMSPAGGRHGRVAGKVYRRIANYVEEQRLGETFAAETGFLLRRDPDTVRAPDAAFISLARLGNLGNHTGYLPLAPDLVAEVVSPNDPSSEVESKALDWLRAGVRVVLVVDPQNKTVREYRASGHIQVYTGSLIDLDDVLPGFQLDVAELFV